METWATFSIIDHLKPIGDQTQEELDQLEAVDYLRKAQAGEPFFCREFSLCDAPETRMNRGGGFSSIYKRVHFVESDADLRLMPHPLDDVTALRAPACVLKLAEGFFLVPGFRLGQDFKEGLDVETTYRKFTRICPVKEHLVRTRSGLYWRYHRPTASTSFPRQLASISATLS